MLGVPHDSNKLERGAALFLRCFVLLLAGYVVFHKVFPFNLLDMHLVEMTGADLLLLCFRSVLGTVAALYFASKAFSQPALRERDRIFCERWAALGLGTILIIACSILMRFVEGEQTIVRIAKLVARAVRWLLF
jgi:H+/Cl- antiporter ClcA